MNKHSIARGLPSHLYHSADVFSEEYDKIFSQNWFALAFTSDCPNEGDVIPIEFMGNPFLLTRDKEYNLRVYYNVCPHRGAKLAACALHKQPFISCPYHAWSFHLDGQLFKTPHIGGENIHDIDGFNKDDYHLFHVPSFEFMGVIFVNPNANKLSFKDTHQALYKRWHDVIHHTYYTHEDSEFSLRVQSNWKLAIENYCESYHLPKVHPELNRISSLSNHYHIEEAGYFSGQGTYNFTPDIYFDALPLPSDSIFNKGGEYLALYPNVLLGAHQDHIFAIIVTPEQPGQTLERIQLSYYYESAITAYDEQRQHNAYQWKNVFSEDVDIVESMHQGRRAKAFDGGLLTPYMDNPTRLFHEWVFAQLA